MKGPCGAVALIVLAMVTVPPGIAQDTAALRSPNLPPGFAAPLVVGRYVRASARDYGTPALGVSYVYLPMDGSADSSVATLYLYQREGDERGWSADSVIASSVAAFKERVKGGPQRGEFDSYELFFEGPDSLIVGKVRVPGYRLAYSFRIMFTDRISYFYLFVAGNTLIKVRATVPESKSDKADLPAFAHGVATASMVRK